MKLANKVVLSWPKKQFRWKLLRYISYIIVSHANSCNLCESTPAHSLIHSLHFCSWVIDFGNAKKKTFRCQVSLSLTTAPFPRPLHVEKPRQKLDRPAMPGYSLTGFNEQSIVNYDCVRSLVRILTGNGETPYFFDVSYIKTVVLIYRNQNRWASSSLRILWHVSSRVWGAKAGDDRSHHTSSF